VNIFISGSQDLSKICSDVDH